MATTFTLREMAINVSIGIIAGFVFVVGAYMAMHPESANPILPASVLSFGGIMLVVSSTFIFPFFLKTLLDVPVILPTYVLSWGIGGCGGLVVLALEKFFTFIFT